MEKFKVLIIFSLIFLLFYTTDVRCASVPAIPNESMVEGVVSEYAIISSRLIDIKPDQVLYRLTIYIESSESIVIGPNFLKNRQGQDVQFYTKEKLSPELFGKRIKARAKYKGDERGGIFWIKGIEIKQ